MDRLQSCRLVRRTQPVTDSRFGENVVRPFRVGFDLLAKLADIDSQILGIGQIVPQFAEEEFVGEYLAGMLNQHPQQIVFFRR